MKHDSEQFSQDDALVFFGRVTASVSHELSNVISTIHQVCGLLDDLIVSSERGEPVSLEKLRLIHGRLSRQTLRGMEVIQNLNRFAHNVDEESEQFELNTVLENLIAVTRRFADLKNVRLEVTYSPDNVQVVNDPVRLQQILFLALERVLETATRDDVLRITVHPEATGPTVKILAPRLAEVATRDSRTDHLQALAESLHSSISFRREEDSEAILLKISGGAVSRRP